MAETLREPLTAISKKCETIVVKCGYAVFSSF